MKNIFTKVLLLELLFFGLSTQLGAQSVVATADPYYICYEGSSQLNAASGGITGTLSYSWTPITGLDDPAIINPIASNLTETIIYTVEVTGNEGTFSDTTKVSVYDELIASIGSDQTICYNTVPDQLTSMVSGGDETYSYQWQIYDGSNWTSIPSATNPTYQPGILMVTTLYQLVVDDGANCGPVTTNSISITVYDELLASIGSDQTICFSTSPDPLTSVVSGGDGTYTYQWQIYDGSNWAIIPSATSPTYQPDILTETTLFQLAINDGANCGPVITNSITITVYDELLATIEPDQTICYSTTPDLLTSIVNGGDETYTYQWQDSPDGTTWTDISGATSDTYQPPSLSNTTYYQLNVDDEVCIPVTSNMVTITVYADFEIGELTGGNTPICYGDDGGTLQSNPSNGSGSYTITWYDGENNQVGTGPTYTVGTLIETTSYYYNTEDNDGCGDENSDPITITVYPEFDIGSITGANTPICYGDDAGILLANPTNGSGNYTITWYDGDNNQVGSGPTYAVGTLTETTSLYYNTVDDAGCGDENSTEITIIVSPMIDASVSIAVSKNPTCDNEEVQFTISDTINGGNNPDFEWFLNGESKSTENTWSSLVSDHDEVMAQMTSNASCLNDNPVISDQITMTVNASPVLLNSGDLVPKPLDNPVVLICVDSLEINTYSWFEDGVEILGADEQFYYPSKYDRSFNFNSEYYVMIENEFCFSNSNLYIYAFNKSALFEESEVFIVYPNPNNGNFSLVLNEEVVPEDFESADIRILDVSGKVIYKEEIYSIQNGLELTGIQNGLYFLEVILSENQRQVIKLIVD